MVLACQGVGGGCLFIFALLVMVQLEFSYGNEPDFNSWKIAFGKKYSSKNEENFRKKIFQDNAEFINKHNSKANRMYNMTANGFADLTHEEFQRKYLHRSSVKVKKWVQHHVADYLSHETGMPPQYVDWTLRKAVSKVKDQLSCACSWYVFVYCDVL